jgi:hypothetical protein
VAGSYTASGTTTTWLSLIDASGSTIGLVNAANVDAGPVTTYTYDPSGTTSATGSANDWPFQYQGMEKEFTDPSTYYYTGSGQFYSPQLSRSLSEVGETSSSQGACPSGNATGARSGSSGFGISFPSSVGAEPETSSEGQTGGTIITITGAAAVGAIIGAVVGAAVGNPLAGAFIGAVAGAIVGDVANFLFGDLFGGGSPPIPRQLRHQRHPLYPSILGMPAGLIPDEMSAGAPQFVGDQHPDNTPPNSDSKQKKQSFKDCMVGAAASPLIIAPMVCVGAGIGCIDLGAPGVNLAACKVALPFCVATAATIAACACGTDLPEF